MTLTVLEGVLAAIFSLSGILVYLFRNSLKSRMSWLTYYSSPTVLWICLAKIAGALGLVLPRYFDLFPFLIPLASLGLAIIMLLATKYHLEKKEYKDLPATIILLALTLLVAIAKI